MAEFHSPDGLRKIIGEVLDANEWHGMALTSASSRADAVLAALFEACEVREEREERRIVIDDEQVTGMWLPTTLAGDGWHVASRYPSGRVERKIVIETSPEDAPVSSTGEEPTGG